MRKLTFFLLLVGYTGLGFHAVAEDKVYFHTCWDGTWGIGEEGYLLNGSMLSNDYKNNKHGHGYKNGLFTSSNTPEFANRSDLIYEREEEEWPVHDWGCFE